MKTTRIPNLVAAMIAGAPGKPDQGLDEAMRQGWTVVDMKNDWKFIFAR